LIAGCVLVGLGVVALAYAYRRRRSVHRWSIAAASFVAAFLITGNLVGFVSTRYLHALLF
jgi:hypothetical protein